MMTTLRFVLAAVTITVALGGAVQHATNEPRTVRGTVVDPAGAPVACAVVRLIHHEREKKPATVATVDSDRTGAFRLATSTSGRHEVEITFRGMRTTIVGLEISANRKDIDVGTVRLKLDCSDPGAICDDFGLR
jgi:hypothetical protein